MTIVKDGEILSDLGESGTDNEATVLRIKESVEYLVSNYCNRTFESTSYTRERYNGNSNQIINLNQYPVTALDRVCVGTRNAIEIKNNKFWYLGKCRC